MGFCLFYGLVKAPAWVVFGRWDGWFKLGDGMELKSNQ